MFSDVSAYFNRSKASDIGQHLEVMREYASNVDSVVEFGVRGGCSTSAWLMAEPKKITCYDINDCSDAIGLFFGFAKEKGIDFKFIVGDSRVVEIEECDLLFIDTHHTYEQLTAELDRHGNKAKKYIICHDTVYDAGCLRAIEDYIERNPHWRIKEHFEYNNGLTVLERIERRSKLQDQLQAWFDERMGPQAVVIEEHFDTLLKYGNMVEHITEFGVHAGASTCCWLMTKPKSYIGYDIDFNPLTLRSVYEAYAKENGTDFTLLCQSSIKEHIEETDLLFIDSDHHSEHVTAELKMQNDKVKRFIILHDTECEACPGLKEVVDKFVEGSADWKIREHFPNNCGLTVLERVSGVSLLEKGCVKMETQERTGAPEIVIHSAVYGIGGDKSIDVTGVVAEIVAKGCDSVVASNDNFKDPAFGMRKQLTVKYSVDGVGHEETVAENDTFTFALPNPESVDDTNPAEITGESLGDGDAAGTLAVELLAFIDEDLQAMCKKQGLSPVGSREELIARLKSVEPTEEPE